MNVEDVFSDLPALETDRLILRRLAHGDAGDIFVYASDPEVSRYTTWKPHQSMHDTLAFLNPVLEAYAKGEIAPWAVVHKADRKVIGTCGFVSWFPRHARAEIAYAIGRSYWNQGLTTEAARAVVAFGFHRMQLNRIEARCEIPNVASARVMEKLGMSLEGILRQHMFAKGQYVDLKLYSILRQEWTG
jgi:ribosomal-protein-alanine N-acetyltransferase